MKPLDILFADEDLVVVNKPAGLSSVHDPTRPDEADLATRLRAQFGEVWAVHRLDRDTSGAIVFALSAEAHRALSLQFEERETTKVYHAVVVGAPRWTERTIDAPLAVNADRKHRTIIDEANGKPAVTQARVLQRFRKHALVEARPLTGRTHQIRAHLAGVGAPIVCDPLYGDGKPILLSQLKRSYRFNEAEERPLIARLALHARALEFAHPATGFTLSIEADYAKDFGATVKQLGKL